MRASSSPPPGDAFEPAVEKTPNGVQREWKSLDEAGEGTTYEVVFLGDPSNLFAGKTQTDERIYAASAQDFAGFDFTGKVVLTARGNQVLFADKHQNAQAAGAAAALIYNNVSGALNASIEGSTATIPCGGLSMEDAQAHLRPVPEERGRPLHLHPQGDQRPPREQRRRREVPHHERLLLLGHDRRPHH